MPAAAFIAQRHWMAEEGLRLDAGAYAGGAMAARDRITAGAWRTERLDTVSDAFTESRFARTYVADPEHGVPYVTASDMLLADLKGLLYLSRKATPQLADLQIRADWTLVSCSGTIGRTAFVRAEMDGLAASHDVIRVIARQQRIAPGYLFAFLSSGPAQAMIRQRTYGSVVQHIEPHHLADIPVPLPDPADQQRIHDLVAGAAAARTEATRLLDEAGAYFDGLVPPMRHLHDHSRAVGVVARSRLDMRLDSFHHVGWAAEADAHGTALGNLVSVAVPGRMKLIHAENGVPFYTGVDIYQVRPRATKRIARWLPGCDDLIVQSGTVLVQVDGQRYGLVGRPAYVGERLHDVAASWHMARLVGQNAPHVFAWARSDMGRRSILRQSFGTSVPSVSAQLLCEVMVPTLPSGLANNARHALALREQADADEERAIREVEAWLG